MSSLVFPTLPGQSWSVVRQPLFSVTLRQAPNFREAREIIMTQCFYEFELSYDMIRNKSGYTELDQIAGLFLTMRGGYDYFRFTDPNDFSITAGSLGIGDGINKVFIFARATGPSYYEAIGYLNTLTGVYINGVLQSPSSYVITQPNVLTFNSAPANGATITATFTYYFLCRFLDDSQQYDQFCSTMYELNQVRLKSVVM